MTTQILYFEQKKCWSPIPSGFSFYKEQLDLYVLKKNDLFAGMDKNRNFVIAPLFNSLEIFRNVIIGTYNGKKGVLSRTETVNKSFYAPILQFVYDDIKKGLGWSCGTLSHLVIVKDGLQGVFCIKDKKILFEPKINEEYNLYTDTIGENSIGFRSKQGEYGFMDFNGNILFTINRFRVVNGKKISTSMIPSRFEACESHIIDLLFIFGPMSPERILPAVIPQKRSPAAAAAEALMAGKLETLLLLPLRDKAFLSAVLYQGSLQCAGARTNPVFRRAVGAGAAAWLGVVFKARPVAQEVLSAARALAVSQYQTAAWNEKF